MTTTTTPRIINGYHVIAEGAPRRHQAGARIVLCYRHDYTFQRFVTWQVWTDGDHIDVAHGHYIDSLTDALADFNQRSFGEVI